MVTATICAEEREYASGEVVDPGVYIDLDTGSVVQMRATVELPEGSRIVHYRRRFKRIDPAEVGVEERRAASGLTLSPVCVSLAITLFK